MGGLRSGHDPSHGDVAGRCQLSPLKRAYLTTCRRPLAFARMELTHGVSCLGCCWLLFAILFPLGLMNVAAMAVITALIFAEKALPAGHRIGQVAAAALIAYGLLVLVVPGALPGTLAGHGGLAGTE